MALHQSDFFYQYCHHRWEGQLLLSWPTWVKYTVPQKTSHLWLAITSTHVHWFWYVLAEMLPIKYTIKRCFTMPPQITSASALPGKMGNVKIVFFSGCISALPEFNQLLLDFFYLFDSRLILTLLYDCLNLVINPFSSGCWGGRGSGERKSRAPQQLDCVVYTMHVHQCAVFLEEKMSSVMWLIASDICWDSKISH